MSALTRRSVVVLAGGRSRRFGDRDKALAPVDGRPMIRRVADRLAPVADELVVNCRRDQERDLRDALEGVSPAPRFAFDPVPDRGPIYGFRTGLRAAAGQYAAVVACDMPFVEPSLLEYLLDRAAERGTSAAVPRADGRRQPLCGAYHVDASLDACGAVAARGDSRLTTLLGCLRLVVADEPTVRELVPARALTNVNTPDDVGIETPDV